MNNKKILILPLAVLMLTQGIAPSWAGPPPNPTPSDGNLNTAGGSDVLSINAGIRNTGFGYRVLFDSTTGNDNTGIGSHSLRLNMTGSSNTANGVSALRSNLSGSLNTANGFEALLSNSIGFENTASGALALRSNTRGIYNTASGSNALLSNITGTHNTANGAFALRASTNGIANTANGGWALRLLTTGSNNTASGYSALRSTTTGSNNLALGSNAGFSLITGNNNIYLKNLGTAAESNTIRIGSNHTRAFMAGVRGITTGLNNAVAVVIDSNGQLGTISSSERFKKDIRDMDDASRRLLELRPVTYHYKQASADGNNPLEYGLIAEEVAKVYPDLVARGADGQIETVQYQKLTPMLLNEMQRLNASLQSDKNKILAQADKIEIQEQEIASLKQQMATVQTQAQRIEALTLRLSRIEAKETLGMVEKSVVRRGLNPG